MPNPAVVDDVEARFWRPLTDRERTVAEAYLGDAWWLLTARRPSLEGDLAAARVQPGNAVRVLAAMVMRILDNPRALLEESIDDYRFRRDSLVSSGSLAVTDDELLSVTPQAVGERRRSVRLVVHGDK